MLATVQHFLSYCIFSFFFYAKHLVTKCHLGVEGRLAHRSQFLAFFRKNLTKISVSLFGIFTPFSHEIMQIHLNFNDCQETLHLLNNFKCYAWDILMVSQKLPLIWVIFIKYEKISSKSRESSLSKKLLTDQYPSNEGLCPGCVKF